MNTVIARSYERFDDARAAKQAVLSVGVKEDDISVVANSDHPEAKEIDDLNDEGSATGTGAGVGASIGGGVGLLAGLGLMAVPGAGPIVAAGWLAATAAGAVAGAVTGAATGGIVGALTDSGVDRSDAETYAESVRRGGILLSIKTTAENEADVIAALDHHRPMDVMAQRSDWERAGWTSYDPDARPYSADEMRKEQNRFM
jgi:uncharacterized membrane protein